MSNNDLALSLIIAAFGIISLLALARSARKPNRVLESEKQIELRKRLRSYQKSCDDFEKRFFLVRSHAPDYILSLPPDTSKIILQFSHLIESQQQVIAQIEALLSSPRPERHQEAEKLIIAHQVAALPSTGEEQTSSNLQWAFEAEANTLLQTIGQNLYIASEKSAIFGAPKSERSKRLHAHLEEAGIIPPPAAEGTEE